jgi:serine/threonine protein kinase
MERTPPVPSAATRENDERKIKQGELRDMTPINRYTVDSILGKGFDSQVYHGIDEMTKNNVAIKRIRILNSSNDEEAQGKQKRCLERIFTELAAFERINGHDFIVNLHSAFYHNHCCYFVMDCFSGGDLRLFLRTNNSLNEKSVVYLLACIGSALHHLHSRGVVHRDVKPENIGLDLRGRPYLADFGISVVSSDENPLPLCQSSSGTLAYLAPEVLCEGNCHSYQSDFWSLGVMGYELLFGKRPFPKHCTFESLKFVRNEYEWMWQYLQSNPSPKLVNFENLRRPIDWVSPYSDPSLCIKEDGTLPKCLIVPIPLHTPSASSCTEAMSVSEECQKLLKGLMDVRIPSRLGSLSLYSEFSEHDCFFLHGYVPFSLLRGMESPLSIGFDFKSHGPSIQISSSFHGYDRDEDDDDFLAEAMLESFPEEIKQRLLNLSYENPEDNSPVGHSRFFQFDTSTPLTFQTPRQTPSQMTL